MARRNVFICDTKGCGGVLVRPEDGFVCLGAIKTTDIDTEPKTLVELGPENEKGEKETVLCRACMARSLSLPAPPE